MDTVFKLKGKNGILNLSAESVWLVSENGDILRKVDLLDIFAVNFYPITATENGLIKICATTAGIRFYESPFSTAERPGCTRDYNFRQAYSFIKEYHYAALARALEPYRGTSLASELEKLAALRERDMLSEEEFIAAKAKLLGQI